MKLSVMFAFIVSILFTIVGPAQADSGSTPRPIEEHTVTLLVADRHGEMHGVPFNIYVYKEGSTKVREPATRETYPVPSLDWRNFQDNAETRRRVTDAVGSTLIRVLRNAGVRLHSLDLVDI